jgi:transglutaminase-like putative cysteine protease
MIARIDMVPSVQPRSGCGFVPLAALLGWLAGTPALADTTYTVRQSFTVKDVPAGARNVRGWFWRPEDRPEQKVLEFHVTEGPPSLRITRDPRYGRSWIYAEAEADPAKPLRVVTEFKVLRRKITGLADATKAGPLTDELRRVFAAELNLHEKHTEVTPEIRKVANQLAGKETNPVRQAQNFFHYVLEKSDHYSRWGPMPKGLCLGSAKQCLLGTGDCCTDQHALFIALCRARGIPCRLIYGSLLRPEQEGRDFDPGYRCWPNFFAPGLGWVPLDVSSADTAPAGRADEWFGGLDEHRLEWAEGRDFDLEPRSSVRPDLVIGGWVEVDGKAHHGLERVLHFTKRTVHSEINTATKTGAK